MNSTAQPARNKANAFAKISKIDWLIPAGLILLSLIPVIAGAARIGELTGGAEITPDNARFFASPIPVTLHIVSVTLYAILGAFQFSPGLRRRKTGWHRTAGKLLIPSGFTAALSGLWMTLFYPWPEYDGAALYAIRLLVGSAMLTSLILGTLAVRRWDFAQHGVWMIRAYAIGMGAGTQVFTHIPWFFFPAIQGEMARTLFMAAGWLINLTVAEWIIRRRLTPSKSAAAPAISNLS